MPLFNFSGIHFAPFYKGFLCLAFYPAYCKMKTNWLILGKYTLVMCFSRMSVGI